MQGVAIPTSCGSWVVCVALNFFLQFMWHDCLQVRVFFSMDLVDMRQEAELIDQIWRDVQAHVDEFSITVTCVYLPLHFDDEEEYSKRKDAVRRSLEEIDRSFAFDASLSLWPPVDFFLERNSL